MEWRRRVFIQGEESQRGFLAPIYHMIGGKRKMKTNLKKLLAGLLTAALLVSAAGCSGGNSSSTAPESKPESKPAAESSKAESGETSTEEPAGDSGLTYDGDEVTITYWHTHGDSEEVVLKEQIVPEFEKQFPKIHVKLVRMPYDGLKQ